MPDSTKYDKVTNFLLDYWIVAILVLLAIIIGFIPSLRDGLIQISKGLKSLFKNERNIYKVKYPGETVTLELKTKSALFDIVKVNATTHHIGVDSEYSWLKKYYPNYKMVMQSLESIEVNESQSLWFDKVEFLDKDGQTKSVYFDISAFFNEGGHTSTNLDQFAKVKIKELYEKKI